MRIDVLTLFPDVFDNLNSFSIIKKAIDSKKVEIKSHNLREFADNSRKVDDYPYGGFPGMVIKIEPIDNCINHLKKNNDYSEVIFMTPDAEKLTQKVSNRLSISGNLIILCGHYKGVDQRVRDNLTTMELSIGDFVLSGGELPAAVLCDSIIRLIPGVLNDETSALEDSFQDGIIAPPVYTRPSSYNNLKVPKILLSGNKEKINEWRDKKSDEKTKKMKF